MPRKPKHPCRYSGCPNLTDKKYCELHSHLESEEDKHYNRFKRDAESNSNYGRAWKKIRERYISTHPLCEQCKQEGRIVPAQEVHHIIPLKNGGSNRQDNLISLCHACHMRAHGKIKSDPVGVSKSLKG